MFQNNTSFINCSKGSTLIPMLMLSAVFAIVGATVMSSYQHRRKMQVHSQAQEQAAFLESNMRMLLSSRNVCKSNITNGGFGNNLQALQDRSAQKKLDICYSTLNEGHKSITKNVKIDKVVIQGIAMEDLVAVDASNASGGTYLGSMRVTLADINGRALRDFVLPMYITTDSAGNLVDCFSSSYPQGQTARLTMEDMLCQQTKSDGGFYYSPREHSCANDPSVLKLRTPVTIGKN